LTSHEFSKLPPNEDSLDLLHEFAQSEVGVRAIDNAGAIPILVALLDMDPLPLACRSALILTSMMHHWMACVGILRAGAVVPLIHLLSRDIGSEILKAIALSLGQCIPWCHKAFQDWRNCRIPAGSVAELSALLGPGQMEVRLAAAQVIRGIVRAEGWTFIRHNGECKKFMAVGLCHLAGDCRDLSEKELAV
jgi:hypothetical protein